MSITGTPVTVPDTGGVTALEMINLVQRELRLPTSKLISDPHAQLLLRFINRVQRDLMMEGVVWDECKVYGSFSTQEGTNLYTINLGTDVEIDIIRVLKIGGTTLYKYSDDEFREYKRKNAQPGQPKLYRIYSRSGGTITVELAVTPDQGYSVEYEVLKKPQKLINADDVPVLDSDTIVAGVVMMARKEQGDDYEGDIAAFRAKLGLQGENQGESNWGDVELI